MCDTSLFKGSVTLIQCYHSVKLTEDLPKPFTPELVWGLSSDDAHS